MRLIDEWSNMGQRFIIAILSIIITSLKFMVNMTSIGISFLIKKNIPLMEMNNVKQENIYVVEHNSNENTHVEMSEYNPKINKRDLLD